MLALTETWLREGDRDALEIGTLCPTGYRFLHKPRLHATGGGVGLLFKDTMKINTSLCDAFQTFEFMDVRVRGRVQLRVLVVYRPPEPTYALFFEEFSRLLERILAESSGHILLIGDFNFHVNDTTDGYANRFNNILNAFDLKQHVRDKTHKDGHTLDLVITRSDDLLVKQLCVQDPVISDHSAIHCDLFLQKPKFTKKYVEFRKLRNMNSESFLQDILDSNLFKEPPSNLNSFVAEYNNVLHELINKHAPLKNKLVTVRPSSPWYTPHIAEEKRKRRRLERKWLVTGLHADREKYVYQCRLVNSLLDSSKSSYYSSVIDENSNDQKVLFKTVNNLLQKKEVQRYPPESDKDLLANRFADFFQDKIAKIQSDLAVKHTRVGPLFYAEDVCVDEFCEFSEVTEDNVRVLANKPMSKSCNLDPLPATILKDSFSTLLPIITKIVNLSLSSGVMPEYLKIAELRPRLKKPDADHEQYSNFRPISNLPMLSKVIEKAVADQVTRYITSHILDVMLQSAYKIYHSTETALVKVQNDILCAIDNGQSVLLLLLDLSAAFDTVNHSLLLSRLSCSYGLKGNVISWFQSYLVSRQQYVQLDGCKSSLRNLDHGVPQGSVLGPLLYSMYTSPIAKIIAKHGLSYHLYADDSQLYVSFKTKSQEDLRTAKTKVEQCINDIDVWMVYDGLKLNQDKSELLVISSKFRLKPTLDCLKVVNESIKPVQCTRNLGVIFDTTLSMNEHVNKVCKGAYYHLRNISKIRKYLDRNSTEILIHAFVSSKLDNCNSLLYGLPDYQIRKLLLIQNTAARIVTLTRQYDHITSTLLDLHWLPVHSRIVCKLLLLVYKGLNGIAPFYITDLLHFRNYSRSLRSASMHLLQVPRVYTKTYGDRAFSIAGPKLWNQLPLNLRQIEGVNSFKKALKTYLFKLAYNL